MSIKLTKSSKIFYPNLNKAPRYFTDFREGDSILEKKEIEHNVPQKSTILVILCHSICHSFFGNICQIKVINIKNNRSNGEIKRIKKLN